MRAISETRNFEDATGMSIRDIEKRYDCTVALQGDIVTTDMLAGEKRMMCCFADIKKGAGYVFEEATDEPEVINMVSLCYDHERDDYVRRCRDIGYHLTASKAKTYMYESIELAFLDTQGNLHFMDFYHDNLVNKLGVWKGFDFIIKDAWGDGKGLKLNLDGIDAEKVEIVKVRVEFDIEKYKAEAEKRIQRVEHGLAIAYKLKNQRLDKLVERTITGLNAKKRNEVIASFLEGLRFSLNVSGWEVTPSGTMLVHKKRIYVTHLRKGDYVYKLPPEQQKMFYIGRATVRISPKLTGVTCKRSHHPNASGNSVCIGDLIDTPLSEGLPSLVGALETAGLDNPFGNHACREANHIMSTAIRENKEGLSNKHEKCFSI